MESCTDCQDQQDGTEGVENDDVEKKENEETCDDSQTTHPMMANGEKLDEEQESGKGKDDSEKVCSERMPYIDRGYAWIIVLACFGTHFLLTGYARSAGVIFVEIQNQFNSSSSMTSLIIGIQEAVCSVSAFIFLGFVLKKTNARIICLIGSVCLVLGVAGNYFANTVEFMIVTQGMCIGMAVGTAYGASLIVISDYFVTRRALATSLVMTGASAGGSALPLLTRYFLDNYGYHGGFLLSGGIVSHCFLFTVLMIPVQNWRLIYRETSIGFQDSKDIDSSDECISPAVDENNKTVSPETNSKPRKANCEDDSVCISNEIATDQEDHALVPTASQKKYEIVRMKANQGVALSHSTNSIHRHLPGVSDNAKKSEKLNKYMIDVSCSRDNISLNPSHEISHAPGHDPRKQSSGSTSHRDLHNGSLIQLTESQDHVNGSILLLTKSHLNLSKPKLSEFSDIFNSASTLHSIADLSTITNHHGSNLKSVAISQEQRTGCLDSCWKLGQSVYASSLTRSASFWSLSIFFILSWTGHIIAFTYIAPLAKERGLSDDDGAFFMSLANILDLFGRFTPGIIVNTGYVKASSVCVLPMFAVGTVGYFTSYMHSYESLLGLVIVYGLFSGVHVCMQSLIVIEMMGLKHYPFVLAFCYLSMSVGATAFFPIAGMMKDSSGTYSTPYYYLASLQLMSVVILLFLPAIKRFDVRRGLLE